jgi:hypothetical protein
MTIESCLAWRGARQRGDQMVRLLGLLNSNKRTTLTTNQKCVLILVILVMIKGTIKTRNFSTSETS